ncbi:MAG: rhodanese-like domain-containing protein [Nitratireductor sp.]|nr:rhodanese-like domain-containing protein [Nitratireductor sp.]
MAIIPVSELVARANEAITTLTPKEALEKMEAGGARFVDIRDVRELEREGKVEGAVHAPRGMLEFWFDPQSPYHRDVFADPQTTYVLFCAAGWRSALATKTLADMGFSNVAHVDGGFGGLKAAGASIVPLPPRKEQAGG